MVFALIAAGPSLDYCDQEIASLSAQAAHFLLSDSIAAGFLRRFRPVQATVFTVELRRHAYLQRIPGGSAFSVMAYTGANERNLRLNSGRRITRFKLLHEKGDAPALYSPGTVAGTMLSYAVAQLVAKGGDGEIHLFGADLFYIDNQVYCRCIDPHAPPVSRLQSRELWQYEMALKKSSGILAQSGFAIRTGFELMQARENMRAFIARLPESIRLVEYSPLGLDHPRVEKRIPGGA
ncbi:MAG: hypothetical protein OHK0011_04160 [Turneriella sp.]